MAFDIRPISSAFSLFGIWVPARQALWFVHMYVGERGKSCFFLKYLWLIVVDDSLKALYVSTKTEFMWGSVNLRVFIVPHTVHSFITITILELHFWTVIVWLVMQIITLLEYKILELVYKKYIQ